MSGSDHVLDGNIEMYRAIDDVIGRFLLNLPQDEPPSVDRLFHHIVQAHWFYEDFYVDEDDTGSISHLRYSLFTEIVFERCPLLARYKAKHERFYSEFKDYVAKIPVCGAILMNKRMDKVALAQNWSGKSWSFPRGKINEGETPFECAIREVYEETGFDCSGLLTKRTHFLQVKTGEKVARYYVVRGVPEDTRFAPQTRKEIRSIRFFPINELPFYKGSPKRQRFWMVRPLLPALKAHVEKVTGRRIPRPPAKSSLPDTEPADPRDSETFGEGGEEWSVEDMLQANEALTGKKFAYDGNPHAFGMEEHEAAAEMAAAGGAGGGKRGRAGDRRDGGGRSRGRRYDRAMGGYGLGPDDMLTFGDENGHGGGGWSVEDMLQANEALTGKKFTYDGNPHAFGMEEHEAAAEMAAAGGAGGGKRGRAGDRRDGGGRSRGRRYDRAMGGYGLGPDDMLTFGDENGHGGGGWSVEDMLQANEALTGKKFTYDGNPHAFGMEEHEAMVRAAPKSTATPAAAIKQIGGSKRSRSSRKATKQSSKGGQRATSGAQAALDCFFDVARVMRAFDEAAAAGTCAGSAASGEAGGTSAAVAQPPASAS